MKVSTKGRYALRLMIELTIRDDGGYVTLGEISRKQGLSVKYLEQIVGPLCRAGLLLSVRGPQGGYKLAKRPENYTAGDVLRATEGELAPVACLAKDAPACMRQDTCATKEFWRGLHKCITQYVDSVSLRDLSTTCGLKAFNLDPR